MKVIYSVLVFALTLAVGVVARQTDTFTTYGAGAASCAAWTEHLKDRPVHEADLQWVLGFVSAAGVFAGVQLKVGPNDIAPFITAHCQANPTHTITSAAATLTGKLQR
jgi:hypothetical protein